ncbi:DUF3347 domain-containing protein [Sphingobacterium paludis]|uniref:Uncharacterized protein DUF3347 n=1 Tax=Sphingobacterium paludis TaxID=1476465 RepID=A0A4R7CST3_9SPHI|nr:DUF3347 domain-containing protein [Sphingobacterium paludis]TDS08887.1 uncharacterized protein DUF3347 [Sphingobacterium paludis]
MKKSFLALAMSLLVFSAFSQNTDKLLGNYIGVKNALVNGDGKAASEAVHTLYQSLKSEENFTQKAELLEAAERLNEANGIEKQRAEFKNVSMIMWKWLKNSDKVNHTIYYQYCPMKNAYWLSNEKEIKNPYYGASMLTCGKVSETKK